MKTSSLLKITLLALLGLNNLHAMAGSQEDLQQQILPLLHHHIPRASVGIFVADAKSGQVLFEHNGYKSFSPASCAKLFSSSASLYALGPDYHFSTDIYYNQADLNDGMLQGNIYIKFSGDPSMTVTKLKELVSDLHQSGLRKIHGNLIIDNTAFLPPWHGPGWSQDDLNWYFAAPITSVIINQNAITMNIIPNPTLNKPASFVITDEGLKPLIRYSHQVNTVTYQQSMDDCQINIDVDTLNNIEIKGCWPSSQNPSNFNLAVRNPDELARTLFTRLLSEQHIKLHGKVITGTVPQHLPVVLRIQSPPLKTLLTTLLKESNNVYAEAITKTMGRELYHEGSFLAGSRAIKSVLKKNADLDFDQIILVDGSGQSRYDLVTPSQIVRLLHVMGNDKQFSELFINALPESGTDGTLSERMKSQDLAHHIHAKTGTLQGVSTLSGYIKTQSGRKLAFSILINQVVGDLNQAKSLQSKIATVLYHL